MDPNESLGMVPMILMVVTWASCPELVAWMIHKAATQFYLEPTDYTLVAIQVLTEACKVLMVECQASILEFTGGCQVAILGLTLECLVVAGAFQVYILAISEVCQTAIVVSEQACRVAILAFVVACMVAHSIVLLTGFLSSQEIW